MIFDSPQLHSVILEILEDLNINTDTGIDAATLQKLVKALSESFSEVELDRDLLEKSLKIASDEMQEHYFQLAQTAKLASLGEMAGNVAHEINNPLQILLGNASTFERMCEREGLQLTPKLSEKIQKMQQQIHRIAKIVSGLKTLGRDGSTDLFTETNLVKVIDETLSLCRAKILSKEVDLRVPQEVPNVEFLSRPSQIAQVLVNLLLNACDAIELTNATPLQDKWIELRCEVTSNLLKIIVIDSGPGVPEEIETKIMQPFFTTKPIGKGTGLGLSVSAAIAKDHGGRLYLDRSQSNSCFVFEIPLSTKTHQEPKAA